VPWSTPVDDPIPLPNGRKLVTLRDAATYMLNLSPEAHRQQEWQAAAEALVLVAERGGPTMFARIGIMRALYRGKPDPDPRPLRKRAKAYRIVK